MKLYNIEFLGQGRVLAESHWYLSFLVRGTIFKLNCLERVLISLFLQDIHTAQNTRCFPLLLFHSPQSLLKVYHVGQLPFRCLYHWMLGGVGSFIGKKDFIQHWWKNYKFNNISVSWNKKTSYFSALRWDRINFEVLDLRCMY